MTSDEIRTAFLGFFKGKEHTIIPSSSLIPKGDPTLLLTSAGMVQFKPYFLGEASPPNKRLTSCQKCFRTTDIELVGDSTHLTFFEMLGNFSIGDYFKREAINWAWEFVTQILKLPTDRLWITIYLEDDESFNYWREIGVPEEKIVRLGEKDNFWGPAGNSGPCGPCSEIHYDFGEEFGCGKAGCAPDCDCARFSEIWNLVFTQYNQDREGQRTPLPKPNIDTGMGLERTAAIMQGKISVYEADAFIPLLECITKSAEVKYGSNNDTDHALRVIAEHSRGIAFLIADGVTPSNEGRGYVLRRILRRAALFSRRLNADKPLLVTAAKTAIAQLGNIYPEIAQRQDFIVNVIKSEEARFRETLSTGLELIENIVAKQKNGQTREISGKDIFRLYDTYGFPVELTKEIATGHNLSVDLVGFEREMEKQRERAKAAHKFELSLDIEINLQSQLNISKTNFTGYTKLAEKTIIAGILANKESTKNIEQGQEAGIILKSTPFYGEMGGQAGDTGEIYTASGRFLVTDTLRVSTDIIIHQGYVTEGSLTVGDEVAVEVDKKRRLDIARNHTTTHLLHFALRQILGDHVQQRGSLVTAERFSFDFTHLTAIKEEELKEIQHIVNDKIRQNLTVYSEEMPYKQAITEGAIALFDEKYGEVVRVIKIGEPIISAELCGGTHISSTGEIGFFHIFSEHSIGAGLRRIEAITGEGAETYIERRLFFLAEMSNKLATKEENLLAKLDDLIAERDQQYKRIQTLETQIAQIKSESLLNQVETIKDVKVLAAKVPSLQMQTLRELCDLLRERLKSGIIVLGTVNQDKPAFLAAVTPDLVARGYDAVKIVKEVAKVTGGGGGGKANLAQAGGKNKDKIDEALNLVKSLI
ncbi:MAG: alanine--tRNA ligase [Dehalococcoidales bacterium]|nr:alanine--tRNA ligase [Dehalococcoidales bacterium]